MGYFNRHDRFVQRGGVRHVCKAKRIRTALARAEGEAKNFQGGGAGDIAYAQHDLVRAKFLGKGFVDGVVGVA